MLSKGEPRHRKWGKMAELLRRILDLLGSFLGLENTANITNSSPPRSKVKAEELSLIIGDNKEIFEHLYGHLREYMPENERPAYLWKKRIESYAGDEDDFPKWNDSPKEWWHKAYGKYLDRAQRQTTYEFFILLELLDKKHIDLNAFAEELREKFHEFDMRIYRDACAVIHGYVTEASAENDTKAG